MRRTSSVLGLLAVLSFLVAGCDDRSRSDADDRARFQERERIRTMGQDHADGAATNARHDLDRATGTIGR